VNPLAKGEDLNRSTFTRPQFLVALGVFILSLAVYSSTMGPTSNFWDCGEFITTSHIVGIPHQPGTPLYVLVGRVFDIILGQADITTASYRTARAINFMSAFFSALAVAFIYLLIWELARRSDPDSGWIAHAGAVIGACFLAFSDTFWNNAIEAEVYGLAGFMMALLSWLAVRWYDAREEARSQNLLLLIIYLLGLGVGFHLGTLLIYPGIFLLVLLARPNRLPVFDLMLMSVGLAVFLFSTISKNNTTIIFLLVVYLVVVLARSFQGRKFALLGSGLFFVGLTVHMMMMIRAGANPEPLINQTDPDNFHTLLSVIRREQYPPMDPFVRRASLGWQFGYYDKFLLKQFYFLGPGHGPLTVVSTVLGPIFLALVGLFQGLRRIRTLILVPLVAYVINGEILTLYLNFTDHEVRDRDYFYFAAFMFFAVFIGLGASALLRYLAGGEGRTAVQLQAEGQDWRKAVRVPAGIPVKAAALLLCLVALLPLGPGQTKLFEHDRSENKIAYEYAWNILAGLDKDAIIFTNGDNDTFPIWYLQMVEKFRPDVSVVNLSLVNLPWYIKQIKHMEHGVDMRRSDAEIDKLQPTVFEDPKTKQRTLVMVKDFALHDIITTNQAKANRPVFFAVTIPQENMERYYNNLRMEGMAYRLVEEKGPNGLPSTDPDKVLENILGVYELGSLMDGDTPARRVAYAQMTGVGLDEDQKPVLGEQGRGLDIAQLDSLVGMLGRARTDIFRNSNAVHLLGNYPAALNRAGYEFYMKADAIAGKDTMVYNENLTKALRCFETSLAIAPFNDQALEMYPLLLVQAFRDDDAKVFLSSLVGNVSEDREEQVVFACMRGILSAGVTDLATDWAQEQIALYPDRKFYYELEFTIYQAMGRRDLAQQVMEKWEQHSGEQDAAMSQALETMKQSALQREQQRIDDAVGEKGDGQD